MIKKAVIAAAGFGTRFLPATNAYPKELLPVLNKPVIHWIVEEMIGAGISEILIIHRHGNSQAKQYFTPDASLEAFLKKVKKTELLKDIQDISKKAKLRFLPQARRLAYGTGSPILAAKSFIGNNNVVYAYGDDLVLEPTAGKFMKSLLEAFKKHHAAAVLGAQEVPWEEVERYGSIRYKSKGTVPYQIETVEEGLPVGEAPSNLVQFGRFVVSPQIISLLEKQPLSAKGELYFTDALKALAQTKVVIARPIEDGKWLTTGDPERWLKTNQEFYQAKKLL